MTLNILDNDDRVVDDEADGENHGEQRQRIDREVKNDKRRERTDQGDRNSEQRDDRRTPALQENVDNEHNEGECFEERLEYFLNRCGDIIRAVEYRIHLKPRREVFLGFLKNFTDAADRLNGVSV